MNLSHNTPEAKSQVFLFIPTFKVLCGLIDKRLQALLSALNVGFFYTKSHVPNAENTIFKYRNPMSQIWAWDEIQYHPIIGRIKSIILPYGMWKTILPVDNSCEKVSRPTSQIII